VLLLWTRESTWIIRISLLIPLDDIILLTAPRIAKTTTVMAPTYRERLRPKPIRKTSSALPLASICIASKF
jgi:hypothetical protein